MVDLERFEEKRRAIQASEDQMVAREKEMEEEKTK